MRADRRPAEAGGPTRAGGPADRVCFVISPRKWDIFHYYSGHPEARRFCYVAQARPLGLCDALFRAIPLIHADDDVLVGLPDTIWFPPHGFELLPADTLSFLLFPVDRPERFDTVIAERGLVAEIQVKATHPRTRWVWGAFRMPARTFRALAVPAGERYYDVGTLEDYLAALHGLHSPLGDPRPASVPEG
jgi:hypothetical protein